MSLRNPSFVRLMQRLEAAFSIAMPAVSLREGSEEIMTSQNGFPEADVSSLSIALYQMGLCKHLPNTASTPPVSPIV